MKSNEIEEMHYSIKDTRADKFADFVASTLGSWRFIIVQTLIIICWIALNVYGYINHWDPYPFILLTLVLSLQAAYAAPIIMMSQNRMEEKDRRRSIKDFETNKKAEREIEELQEQLTRIEDKLNIILNKK